MRATISIGAAVRRRLARSPWLYWAVVAGCAAAAALLVAHGSAGIDAARREWGETRNVLVADRDISPGDDLAAATSLRAVPLPLIPAEALDTVDDGVAARQSVAGGEIVVAIDAAPVQGRLALLPDGWLAVAISEAVPTAPAPGDRVQVASGGLVIADEGIVAAVSAEAVIVGVPAADAATVAAAAATGDVALLLGAAG